jgi:hypothetical protein
VKSVLWAAAKLSPPALASEEPQAPANGDGSQQ